MKANNGKQLRQFILEKVPTVTWILIVMMIYFSASNSNFLTFANAANLCRQGAILLILCLGVIVVKITGGIELSNGAVMSLCGMVLAWVMVNMNMPPYLAIIISMLVGILFGTLNGIFVTFMGIPSFVATLGTQGIAVGLALGMNNGNVIGGLPERFSMIGNDNFLNIPIPLWAIILVFILTSVLLNRTPFGVYVYALGGNEEALKLSGKPAWLYKVLAYSYSGLTAGIAACILTSRNMAAQPTVGLGMEFEAFAGAVLGGSYIAGKGTAMGGVLGGIFILILRNGLNILGIPTYLQLAIFGTVLITAIVLSTLVERRVQKMRDEEREE